MKQSVTAGSKQLQVHQSQPVVDDRIHASDTQSFVDNRPETIAQRELMDAIRSSPKMIAQRNMVESFHYSPRMVAQRNLHNHMNSLAMQLQAAPEEELLQGKSDSVRRVEEEPLQGKFAAGSPAQLEQRPAKKPNNTGLPDNLKSGIENLSGLSMDFVRVHYNSSQPAQLNALAYAQRASEGRKIQPSLGNRSSAPGKVAQLITYLGKEYTREIGNMKDFHATANVDLNKLDPKRDADRDKKMLNVIGNGEDTIESPQELLAIIHPDGKGYQIVLNNELKELSPTLLKIIELALGARDLAPVMRKDSSTESHEYVIMNMVQIKEKTEDVKKRVQWKKLDSVDSLADASIEKARTSMVAVLEYSDPSLEPSSKQQDRKKQKQEENIDKGIMLVVTNTGKIAQTASEIGPELRNSADEQYLRGTVGAGLKGSTKHLIIGKKTATKPLLERDPEEAKGILWASVWSMGVNQAFIEGGTDSEHEFRLISPFPPELEESLRSGNVEEFIRVAREGTIQNDGADPWRAYYHKGNKKLTTLGEEIVHLLKNGYVLE